MRLVAEPHIPFAFWLALALLATGVMVWYAFFNRMSTTKTTRAIIVGLMSLTLALPLVVLLNLTWIQNVPPPAGKPVVRVLVDTSASMSTVDSSTNDRSESRLDKARSIAEEAAASLSEQFEVRISLFDQTVVASDIGNLKLKVAESNATNIATAIADSIKEDIPQGQSILLLSDGIHNANAVNDVIENASRAQAMNVPIFTATIGGEIGVKNIAVTPRSPQELAFVGQSVPIVVNVESMGLGSQRVEVELWNDGRIAETQTAEIQTVNAGSRFVGQGDPTGGFEKNSKGKVLSEATFNLSQSAPGLYRYEVRIVGSPGEATTADNRSTILFRVVDRPIKMLLVEGKPYWDTKFLVRRLAADQSVELTSVIRMAQNRYMKRTIAQSGVSDESKGTEETTIIRDADSVLSAGALRDVQIVVLGRNAEYFLSDDSQDALRNWISRDGGSLVCARGAPSAQINQRLGQILPVRWTMGRENRFRVSMTSQGKDLRWLANFGESDVLGAMPSLATVATANRREGLSNVLAATVDSAAGDQVVPVLSYQPYGSGRTVVVEGAGMWRWALMSPEYSEQEEVYSTLWRSLLRWLVSRAGLMPGQDISLQPDRVSFDAGDVSTATMLVRQTAVSKVPNVRVQSVGSDDFDQEFQARPVGQDPGVYRLDFGKLPPGQYTAAPIRTLAGIDGESNADSIGSKKTIESLKTAFDVRESWVEKLELDARSDLMARIAETSGGAVLDNTNPEAFADKFQEHLIRSRPPQYRRVAMWDRWWVMGAILLLWTTTWIVRRRSGLI